SAYNAQNTEDRISKLWEDSGFYNPDEMIAAGLTNPNAEPFSMVLPPPNVTGTLHTGHASMLAIEDIMTRYNRMLGKRTLWLPGTDHAAIATQSKVEKILAKEKIRKHDLGREKFLKRVHQFAQESHDTIVSQAKKMGASLDWSREAFTLDKKREHAVYTAFERMYADGLVYKADRIVNWDVRGQTVISDDEIVHIERDAEMYTFKYSTEFPISISTTRPETKVGDTAVAVHPDDERYAKYIGKTYDINFCGSDIEITIISDHHVDPEFGTGALGVTPAHSIADWEIAQRNPELKIRKVINEYGKMTNCGEILEGMKVAAAREHVVEWLSENDLLENTEVIKQNVSTAERTGGIIEPLPKMQWWIDTEKKFAFKTDKIDGIKKGDMVSMKEVMLHVVRDKQIDILPARFEKVYFNWIENLRPWNISRQIWYGHQIPVWYKGSDIHIGATAPDDSGWTQDEDTLDTWFSSGLWTFSTLGWPNEDADDFKTYHPTTILETGHDIIFFWVARMILMTTYLLGDVPFKTTYLHGMVRDNKGRKMSKSLGNIVNPVDLINKYGTDALRMAMIVGNGPGNDVNLDENKIKAYSKFGNKLWNITRFILTETENFDVNSSPEYSERDNELTKNQNLFLSEITTEMNEFRYYIVSEKIYHYTWDIFAGEILEESKAIFENGTVSEKSSRQYFLINTLKNTLKTLHPFMPFITEEIWQELPKSEHDREILMTELWPE
ncbi:MAG: valine--tRNA ligase, partial [Candidatus Pacebacteria bacterium]|nr:valine--tRNA ligase [Candidatus Paceibacterota bacterium]